MTKRKFCSFFSYSRDDAGWCDVYESVVYPRECDIDKCAARFSKLLQLPSVLESLRREHYTCEDDWYNCPKSEEGCPDEDRGEACRCGADAHNARIDAAIKALREA